MALSGTEPAIGHLEQWLRKTARRHLRPRRLPCIRCAEPVERNGGYIALRCERCQSLCLDCGVDISMRGSMAMRCEACAKEHRNRKAAARYEAQKQKRGVRLCADCGTDISNKNAQRQRYDPCRKKRTLQRNAALRARHPEYRQRENKRRAERYATDPEFRAKTRARLKAHRARRRHAGEWVVDVLLVRDGPNCRWCGERLDNPHDTAETHVDHIHPRAKGGAVTDVSNLQLLHARCNIQKHTRSMKDAPISTSEPFSLKTTPSPP